MPFKVGQVYERIDNPTRWAIVMQARNNGREGRLSYFYSGEEEWVLWGEFEKSGAWRLQGGQEG
jgi:hypothetical protein